MLMVDAPEEVIVLLVGHLLALLDHLLLAVWPLHLLTLHTGLHRAHGAALGPVLLSLCGDLLLLDNGFQLGLGHVIIPFEHLHVLLDLLVYQLAVLHADV